MGILDRIAGTLDELRGGDADSEARAREEIALARGFAERGDFAAAAERLADVTRRHPRLAAVHAGEGDLLARRGDHEEAAAAYGRAADLDPADAEAWLGLGLSLGALGRFEPARDAFRRSLTLPLGPDRRPRAQAGLGRLYAQAGQLGKAIRELRKAAAALPDDADTLAALGRALVAAGESDGPDWLARAARLPGGTARLLLEAADAKEDIAAAERLLREAVTRAPADAAVRAALARHLVAAGDFLAALPEALAGTAMQPGDAATWNALREVYVAMGDFRAAIETAGREALCGKPPPFSDWLSLALGSENRAAIESALAHGGIDDAGVTEARALLAGSLDRPGLVKLAGFAPGTPARRFVVRTVGPRPVPAGNIYALLSWAGELATRQPALLPLAVPMARAVEAFDRPLLIAVMGEFNTGKSSFVNALAGELVAPVGATPTTATINVLRHGPGGGRVIYHDGTVRNLAPNSVGEFLGGLGSDEAKSIRQVEIFAPLESLRRVEIVDTPGLNSLRPEHEKVARAYLIEADAIVWMFAAGQAAKATEREALVLARQADKKVLGVVNKIDRASADEIREVLHHVEAECADLVERVVPLSARAALDARRRGDLLAIEASGLPVVEAALEAAFFTRARQLKRATALAALRRFTTEAHALLPVLPVEGNVPAAGFATVSVVQGQLRSAIAGERVALRARLDQGIRAVSFEVREFVRPRTWLLGEHTADPADEDFLCDLLDDAALRATAVTRDTLVAAISSPAAGFSPDLSGLPDLIAAVDDAIERFRAYARGIIEGAAAVFFRVDLPRIRLDLGAIYNALARWSPDPEEFLFRAVERAVAAFGRYAHADLLERERAREIATLILEEHALFPLDALEQAVAALALVPMPEMSP